MSKRPADAGERDGAGGRAAGLLVRGERHALAGRLAQAERLLAEAWEFARGADPPVADAAAWALGWLLVRRGAFAEAGGWFGRVCGTPANGRAFWPFAREQLTLLCARAAREPAPASVVPAGAPLPPLRVIGLGRFQLARGGEPLPACKTRRSVSILRYLLTRPHRAASKAELMELFWPGADSRQASHSLHTAISNLRQYLDCGGESYVLFQGGRYCINPRAQVDDDCAAFLQLLDEAGRHRALGDEPAAERAYLQALACYAGDYYVDEHELEWAATERERLRVRQLAALEQLARLYAAQSRVEEAIDCCQRLLARDAHREDIHALAMRCYWRLGRRGEALRQYERCADALVHDLGIAPAEPLRDLYRAILADAQPEAAGEGDVPQPSAALP
ncbi:MAG TPA: BTAD domain-containing putative transcriptional regulator [Roseiflexaceae bacterium]|nr:BTAD domain-containing putative transcriptional regulator [Roseiflexaceae bacterium]